MNDEYMLRFDSNLQRRLMKVQQLLNKKHRKYGNKPITKTGLMGIITKLDIKLERIRHLEADETLARDEWKEETEEQLIDIAGYGLLGLMWLHGELK